MGIKNISKIIKEYGEVKTLNNLKNKKIAIDTSIFLYKFMYSCSDVSIFLKRFVNQIKRFKKNDIIPVYVFEGKPPEEKQNIIQKRKDTISAKKELLKNTSCEETCEKIKKNIITITEKDIQKLKQIMDENMVEYIDSPTEGEKYCAYLNKIGEVDLVLSNDYDTLTFGCKNLLRDDKGIYVEYSLNFILSNLEISYEYYIDLCIACGCDYTPGIRGIGPKKGLQLIKKHGLIENWPDVNLQNLQNLNDIRDIFKNFELKK